MNVARIDPASANEMEVIHNSHHATFSNIFMSLSKSSNVCQ